ILRMIISTLVTIHSHRYLVPASLLSLSMVPMGAATIVSGALSWILPRRVWESLDNTLYRGYMRLCLFVFENISGVDLILSGDVYELLTKKDRAIILSNHQSNADWAVAFMLAARHSPSGALESLRFMVKHSIQYVPLFGWYIFQHGYIFVRRAGSFKEEPVRRQLRWLNTLSTPFWLLIFPEGTRMARSTLERSKEFREKKGLTQLERVLSPRAGGLRLCMEELNSLDAIYDLTIAYSQPEPPGMFGFVCCPMNSTVHVDVRRREPSEVGEDTIGYLEKSFQHKENLLSTYSSHKSFFPPEQNRKMETISMSETLPVTSLFVSTLAAPFFSPIAAQLFVRTISMSPLLFAWIKITKCT
ncbi:hypothetical protein PENTCL1PPCAC_23149, partial [Pristionchus entomophagus]